MQGFGQHEPLRWLDLHGCSFVRDDSARQTRVYFLTSTLTQGLCEQRRGKHYTVPTEGGVI
jgi:hypothetical protein